MKMIPQQNNIFAFTLFLLWLSQQVDIVKTELVNDSEQVVRDQKPLHSQNKEQKKQLWDLKKQLSLNDLGKVLSNDFTAQYSLDPDSYNGDVTENPDKLFSFSFNNNHDHESSFDLHHGFDVPSSQSLDHTDDSTERDIFLESATELEWSRAEEAELLWSQHAGKDGRSSRKHLRVQNHTREEFSSIPTSDKKGNMRQKDAMYPYIICCSESDNQSEHTDYLSFNGYQCRSQVKRYLSDKMESTSFLSTQSEENQIKVSLKSLYNHDDMTCFYTNALSSWFPSKKNSTKRNSDEIGDKQSYTVMKVQPFLPEMKFGKGFIQSILPKSQFKFGDKKPGKNEASESTQIDLILCPVFSGDLVFATELKGAIFDSFNRLTTRKQKYKSAKGASFSSREDYPYVIMSANTKDWYFEKQKERDNNSDHDETHGENIGIEYLTSALWSLYEPHPIGGTDHKHLQYKSGFMTSEGEGDETMYLCRDLFDSFTIETSRDHEFLTVITNTTTDSGLLDEIFGKKIMKRKLKELQNKCLLNLSTELVKMHQICGVERSHPLRLWNNEAQWIVQGNHHTSSSENNIEAKDKFPFYSSGITGKNQVISCSDSGLDVDHCYFTSAKKHNAILRSTNGTISELDYHQTHLSIQDELIQKDGSVDFSQDKVIQYENYADDQDSYASHGTHVAGTLVGNRYGFGSMTDMTLQGKNSNSTHLNYSPIPEPQNGIAYDARLSFFDIGYNGGNRLKVPSDIREIFESSYLNADSHIHSASWGTSFNGYAKQDYYTDKFMYENDDYLVVVAAGNSGSNPNMGQYDIPNTVGGPATSKNCLSVGASQSDGSSINQYSMMGMEYLAHFSSRGPSHDGRTKPDIIAPGFFVKSANAIPTKFGECDVEIDDFTSGTTHNFNPNHNSLAYKAGTSMATPVVSGTAALVRQYLQEGWYRNGKPSSLASDRLPNPSAPLLKAILLNGAQYLRGVQNRYTVTQTLPYDNNQNFGRVSLWDSLPLAGKNHLKMDLYDRKMIQSGDTHQYPIQIDLNGGKCDVSDLNIMLVWNDPPAGMFCSRCLVNDLDLYATSHLHQNSVSSEEAYLDPLLHVNNQTESMQNRTRDSDQRLEYFYPNGLNHRDDKNNAERIRISPVEDGNNYTVKVHAKNLDTESQMYSLVISGCLLAK